MALAVVRKKLGLMVYLWRPNEVNNYSDWMVLLNLSWFIKIQK